MISSKAPPVNYIFYYKARYQITRFASLSVPGWRCLYYTEIMLVSIKNQIIEQKRAGIAKSAYVPTSPFLLSSTDYR